LRDEVPGTLDHGFPLTRKQRVARPGKVCIHLRRRSIDVPSLDHCKDALVLIGDHLGIKQMTPLHLRHAQVRLADNRVMKALDSRAARGCDQGAMELDVVFDELGNLAVVRDGSAKTVERPHCASGTSPRSASRRMTARSMTPRER